MCTVTWYPGGGGYSLWVNRDERRERPRARAPQVQNVQGKPVLLPTDPEGGGTWVAVNADGLGLSLLNDHRVHPPVPSEGWISRGRLVLQLAPLETSAQVASELDQQVLARFRPFQLLVLAPDGRATLHRWNGARLDSTEPVAPLSSSGYDTDAALAARQHLLETTLRRFEGDRATSMARFHRSHEPARGALSPCMHRDEATTVSLTVVEVTQSEVSMAYADGPPCRTQLGASLVLARRAGTPTDTKASAEPR